jgi:hypothetical protein
MQEMSYNNYLDADAAWNCVSEFTNPTCVVVKHTNPCGVASRNNLLEAYRLAVEADPVSAFGGIVAFNVEVDEVNFDTKCFAFMMLHLGCVSYQIDSVSPCITGNSQPLLIPDFCSDPIVHFVAGKIIGL